MRLTKTTNNCCNAFIWALSCKYLTSLLLVFLPISSLSRWILKRFFLLKRRTEESDSLMIVQRIEQWIWMNDLYVVFLFSWIFNRRILPCHSHLFPLFHWCAFIFQHFSWLFRCTSQSNAIEIFSTWFFFVCRKLMLAICITLNMHICLTRFEKSNPCANQQRNHPLTQQFRFLAT